jgi:hypothetical protein
MNENQIKKIVEIIKKNKKNKKEMQAELEIDPKHHKKAKILQHFKNCLVMLNNKQD